MSNAPKDQNSVSGLLAVLNTDGQTVMPVMANATNNTLRISDGAGGSDNGPTNAQKDGNSVSSLVAVSSVDGITPVVCYCDSSGRLLVKST